MEKQTIKEFQRAVIFSDLNTIRQVVESDSFDKCFLADLGVKRGIPIPITYYTAAQLELFNNAEDWDTEGWALAAKRRALEVWHYWKNDLLLDTKIDYHRFAKCDIMYCNDFETDEEILEMTFEEIEKRGLHKIDADLYIACWRIDIEKVNRLFNAGANPNATMDDEDSTALGFVEAEIEFLYTLIFPLYESYANRPSPSRIVKMEYMDLLAAGAFERMHNILQGRGVLDYERQ